MVLYLTVNEAKNFFANAFETRAGVAPCKEYTEQNWERLLRKWGYNIIIVEDF